MSFPPVKTLPLGDFWLMQVKWTVGLLVLVSWDWHLHFFWVQQEKPGRMQMTSPPQSCRLAPAGAATSHGTKQIQRVWIHAFPSRGHLCKPTSLPPQGSRQEADALTEDFWLQPQPIVSRRALGDTRRRGLSPPHAWSLCTALDYARAQKCPGNLVSRHKQKSSIKTTGKVKSLLQSRFRPVLFSDWRSLAQIRPHFTRRCILGITSSNQLRHTICKHLHERPQHWHAGVLGIKKFNWEGYAMLPEVWTSGILREMST